MDALGAMMDKVDDKILSILSNLWRGKLRDEERRAFPGG